MVMDFGMSRLGRVTYRENSTSRFLGGEPNLLQERSHSEETAREIDQELKHIVDRLLAKTREILEARRQALVALAERLLEKEVIDNAELRETVEANSPGPAIVPGTQRQAKESTAEDAEQRKAIGERG